MFTIIYIYIYIVLFSLNSDDRCHNLFLGIVAVSAPVSPSFKV